MSSWLSEDYGLDINSNIGRFVLEASDDDTRSNLSNFLDICNDKSKIDTFKKALKNLNQSGSNQSEKDLYNKVNATLDVISSTDTTENDKYLCGKCLEKIQHMENIKCISLGQNIRSLIGMAADKSNKDLINELSAALPLESDLFQLLQMIALRTDNDVAIVRTLHSLAKKITRVNDSQWLKDSCKAFCDDARNASIRAKRVI